MYIIYIINKHYIALIYLGNPEGDCQTKHRRLLQGSQT